MKYPASIRNTALVLVSLAALTGIARGTVVLTFDEIGGDVVADYSGALIVAGLTDQGWNPAPSGGQAVDPSSSSFVIGSAVTMNVYTFYGTTAIAPFGSGTGPLYADSSTGSLFAMMVFNTSYINLFVPGDYVSGQSFSGSATWEDTTLVDMGLTPGSVHLIAVGVDTIVVEIGESIPEPSVLSFLAVIGIAGLARRRRN